MDANTRVYKDQTLSFKEKIWGYSFERCIVTVSGEVEESEFKDCSVTITGLSELNSFENCQNVTILGKSEEDNFTGCKNVTTQGYTKKRLLENVLI
jgi:hypothetical protein